MSDLNSDPRSTAKTVQVRKGPLVALPLLAAVGMAAFLMGRSIVTSAAEDKASPPAVAATETVPGFTSEQKTSIETIVKTYLLAHPEVLMEVQSAFETKMQKEQEDKTKAMVAENAKDIYRHPDAAVAGNPNGDITVVEFFDYNCGYCKRGFPAVAKLIESDKNVRVVFKELPIISDASEPVSRIALASKLQGKYWEMHKVLISHKGTTTEAVALKAAEELGLDMTKLKSDMNSDSVKGELTRVKDLAQKMGINGTPHFLVGDRSVGGAPENLTETLAGHIAELRKSGCSYC
jgi:protein-disulfide isomerase